jgi:hypothetical protein
MPGLDPGIHTETGPPDATSQKNEEARRDIDAVCDRFCASPGLRPEPSSAHFAGTFSQS